MGASVTPTIRSAVRRALESQASARISVLSSQVTQIDEANLVRKIMSILRPEVVSAINDAISAKEAAEARARARAEQQRQAALREQQRKEAARQAALREQQRLEAARLEAERLAALQATQTSGDLNSLFGTGHEVIQNVPGQTLVEYHIGVGSPANVGFPPTGLQPRRPNYG